MRRDRCGSDGRRGVHQPALVPQFWQRTVAGVLREGENFGAGARQNERISLEFGSANPTGPLLVVQGRTLSIGDTLAKTLRFAGYSVFTEWIINDAGSQMDTLARSLYARYMQLWDAAFPFPDEGYPADYLVPIAERIRSIDGAHWRTAAEAEWMRTLRRSDATTSSANSKPSPRDSA